MYVRTMQQRWKDQRDPRRADSQVPIAIGFFVHAKRVEQRLQRPIPTRETICLEMMWPLAAGRGVVQGRKVRQIRGELGNKKKLR